MHFPHARDEDTNEIKAQRKKREEDELICRGHNLNTLSDRLYDLYTSMKSPKEIWNALEAKYKTEKIGTNKFIIQNYFCGGQLIPYVQIALKRTRPNIQSYMYILHSKGLGPIPSPRIREYSRTTSKGRDESYTPKRGKEYLCRI